MFSVKGPVPTSECYQQSKVIGIVFVPAYNSIGLS